jgi:hypothetical protein
MPEKLFVGGLPFDFTDEQLGGLFTKVGQALAADGFYFGETSFQNRVLISPSAHS